MIDPNTGYPVQGMQSVTVLIPPQAQAGVLSDVASKPIFIAKANEQVKQASVAGVNDFLIMAAQDNIQVSTSMQAKLNWLDTKAEKAAKVVTLE